jgi:uncharacterized protein
MIMKYILSIVIGSIIGFIGGFQGIAGGFYISALLLATGIVKTFRQAAGTTLLAIVFPISIGAIYEYYQSNDIDIYAGLIIAFFYMIAAYFGAKASKFVDQKYITLSLAILLFLTSTYFFNKFKKQMLK